MPCSTPFKLITAVLLATAAGASPLAADSQGNFAIKGIGTQPCANFVVAAEAADSSLPLYVGYIGGYFSSLNEHQAETFDILPWQHMETIMLILLRQCRQAPDKTFARTVSELAQYFQNGRLASLAPRKTLGQGAESVELYTPIAEQLRQALDARGYDTEDLYKALQQFREDQALPAARDNLQTVILSLLYGGSKS